MSVSPADHLDPRRRRYLAPTRVLWTSPESVDGAERLLAPGTQAVVSHPTPCTLHSSGAVLLDFGRELHGGIQIITSAYSPKQSVRVRLRFGESASEAMGATDQDHAFHDGEILVPWCGAIEVGQTGFRFARLDLVHPGARLDLVGVRAVSIEREEPRLGWFRCSDPRVDAVWETAARTVELCMQDVLWDGIKRDRLAWMGDLHPEAMVVAALYGNHQCVRDTLDFLRDTTPLPGWMNGMQPYSLWWLITHRDWWRRLADRAFLERQRGYLAGLVAQIAATVREDGESTFQDFFVDWASRRDAPTSLSGRQSLTRIALDAGAELLRALGEPTAAVDAVIARLDRHGAPQAITQQAAALAVLAGMRDAHEAERAVFAPAPYAGLSPFYGYYVLEARTRADAIDGCLDLLRGYWAPMIDLGGTSFWEHFDVSWLPAGRIDELPRPGERDIHRDVGDHCYVGLRHSLCHGWSGGPAAWLIDRVLGIEAVEPGYRRVRIAPRLGALTWAEGAVATAYGVIRVRHERLEDGTVTSEVALPAGVERV